VSGCEIFRADLSAQRRSNRRDFPLVSCYYLPKLCPRAPPEQRIDNPSQPGGRRASLWAALTPTISAHFRMPPGL
jgi:hypothetical protein